MVDDNYFKSGQILRIFLIPAFMDRFMEINEMNVSFTELFPLSSDG